LLKALHKALLKALLKTLYKTLYKEARNIIKDVIDIYFGAVAPTLSYNFFNFKYLILNTIITFLYDKFL